MHQSGRKQIKMETRWISCFALVLVGFVSCGIASDRLDTETVLINVTTLTESETHKLQMSFNISVAREQMFVNDVPVTLSGVTRMACQAILLDSSNTSSQYVTVVARLLLRQWPLDSDPTVELLVFNEEVIEVDGKKVQQPDMYEVNILMNKKFQKLRQSTYSYPLLESMLYSIPRDSDVVVVEPNASKTVEDQRIPQTTSNSPLKPSETTQEETAAPGKLPETPLRMEPLSWSEEEMLPDKLLPETPLRSDPDSSYNAMCRWVEDLRDRLRLFWRESLPIFFMTMWVVVVGVAGAAVIIRLLELVFPSCDHRGNLSLNPATLLPEEEKQCLLLNMDTATDDTLPLS